jgi:enoyl-CoA hydratase/carnithine racemase
MKNQSVSVSKEGDVFVLSMNAGENRFNPAFISDMNSALDFIER